MHCYLIALPKNEISSLYQNIEQIDENDWICQSTITYQSQEMIMTDWSDYWEALHFLLTDSQNNPINADKLSYVVRGYYLHDCEPANFYSGDFFTFNDEKLVKEYFDELKRTDIKVLLDNMDFNKFYEATIYPYDAWKAEDDDDEYSEDDMKACILYDFKKLIEFYQLASKQNKCLIFLIN